MREYIVLWQYDVTYVDAGSGHVPCLYDPIKLLPFSCLHRSESSSIYQTHLELLLQLGIYFRRIFHFIRAIPKLWSTHFDIMKLTHET